MVCHNDTYRRSLQPLDIPVTVLDWQGNTKTYMTPRKNAEGNYTMQPRFDLMPPGTTMVSLAQNVHLPTRATCLRCHAGAGGGDGVKRGDISTATINPSLKSDVHMSPQGGNFTCQTCHIPTFAKDVATEMSRDWTHPAWNPAACSGQGGWVGEEVKASNVVPTPALSAG